MHNIHLLVSTGQNISNLIPLLQFAEKDDAIVILESKTARNNNWGSRLRDNLKNQGFKQISVEYVSDIDLLSSAGIDRAIKPHTKATVYEKVYVYLNGGQKLTAVSLLEALRPDKPHLVYMESRPVRFLLAGSLADTAAPRIKHIDVQIELQDVLALYGSCLHNEKEAKVIYKNGTFHKAGLNSNGALFWKDKDFIKTVLFFLYASFTRLDDHFTPTPVPGLQTITQIVAERWDALPLKKLKFNTISAKPLKDRQMEWTVGFIKSVINKINAQARKPNKMPVIPVSTEMRDELIANRLLPPAFSGHKISRMDLLRPVGFFFEEVVLFRLYCFLQKRPQICAVISQIWQNVKVSNVKRPQAVSGEYDILIVLKNGLLISLECKTYDFEAKDAFSRLARLTIRGGGLAVQWVTAPFFTDPDLFRKPMFDLWQNMKDLNIPFIPFGQPSQSPEFSLSGTDETVYVSDFDLELERCFMPFL